MAHRDWKRQALLAAVLAAVFTIPAPKAHALIVFCPTGTHMIPPGICVADAVASTSSSASSVSPWPVIAVGIGVVSIMVNATVVGRTQCRELTLREAMASLALPFLGMAFNEHNNRCRVPLRSRARR